MDTSLHGYKFVAIATEMKWTVLVARLYPKCKIHFLWQGLFVGAVVK